MARGGGHAVSPLQICRSEDSLFMGIRREGFTRQKKPQISRAVANQYDSRPIQIAKDGEFLVFFRSSDNHQKSIAACR